MGKYLPNFKELEGLMKGKFIKFDSEHWHLFCPFLPLPIPHTNEQIKDVQSRIWNLQLCSRGLSLFIYWIKPFNWGGASGKESLKSWETNEIPQAQPAKISATSPLQKTKHLPLNFKVFLQMLSKAPSSGSYTKVEKKANGKMFLPDT